MKKPIANEYWLTSTGFQPLRGLWRHQKVLKGTVSSPVYPKTMKRAIPRARGQSISGTFTHAYKYRARAWVHYATHARIFFAHVLPNSALVLSLL